jgi:hypothetical protein
MSIKQYVLKVQASRADVDRIAKFLIPHDDRNATDWERSEDSFEKKGECPGRRLEEAMQTHPEAIFELIEIDEVKICRHCFHGGRVVQTQVFEEVTRKDDDND